MTKADFEKLEELFKGRQKLKGRLRDLRNASEVSAVNYSATGGNGGTGDCVSRTVCSVDETEREISENEQAMNRLIDTEDKAHMRELLRLHFVHMLSWAKIAAKMGYNDSAAVYRKFKRYKRKMTMDTTMPHGVK